MKYCNKCGWKMEYKPTSFQEYIKEVIEGKFEKGYYECPKCGMILKPKTR